MLIFRRQVTAEGRVFPRIPPGTTEVLDEGQFLLFAAAGLFWIWKLAAADGHILDQPRNLFMLAKDPSTSTELAHEVGGDSAEVKGQDIPVIVGIGS